MREAGLQGARRGKATFTTRGDDKAGRPPDLVAHSRQKARGSRIRFRSPGTYV